MSFQQNNLKVPKCRLEFRQQSCCNRAYVEGAGEWDAEEDTWGYQVGTNMTRLLHNRELHGIKFQP